MSAHDYWKTDNSANEDSDAAWEAAQAKLDRAITAAATDAELFELANEILGRHTRQSVIDLLTSDTTTVTESVARWAA